MSISWQSAWNRGRIEASKQGKVRELRFWNGILMKQRRLTVCDRNFPSRGKLDYPLLWVTRLDCSLFELLPTELRHQAGLAIWKRTSTCYIKAVRGFIRIALICYGSSIKLDQRFTVVLLHLRWFSICALFNVFAVCIHICVIPLRDPELTSFSALCCLLLMHKMIIFAIW